MFRPEYACQKRLSWFSDWNLKVQKCANLVDLVKSFSLFLNLLFEPDSHSNEYLMFTCKWGRYSRERASQSLQKVRKKVRKNIGHGALRWPGGRPREGPRGSVVSPHASPRFAEVGGGAGEAVAFQQLPGGGERFKQAERSCVR